MEAAALSLQLEGILGETARQAVFAGRLGYGAPPKARSLRLPLPRLLIG